MYGYQFTSSEGTIATEVNGCGWLSGFFFLLFSVYWWPGVLGWFSGGTALPSSEPQCWWSYLIHITCPKVYAYVHAHNCFSAVIDYLYTCISRRNCQDDQALYSAFNLSNLLPAGNITSQIQTLVNFSQVGQLLSVTGVLCLMPYSWKFLLVQNFPYLAKKLTE